MCSACITSSPGGVEQRGRAVAPLLDVRRVGRADQHRAHLLAGGAQRADQDLERDRVEPAGAHRCAPRTIVPRVVDLAPASPAAAPGSPRAARTRTALGLGARPPGSPRSTSASDPLAAEARPPRASARARPAGAASGCGAAARHDQRQADVDQLDLRVGVAVAVAALVLGGEALGQLGRVGRAATRRRASSNAWPR